MDENNDKKAEYELKKYEELYSLTKSELEKGHSRFEWVEEKASRHFSVLVNLLAFISIGMLEYISILKSKIGPAQKIIIYLYPVLIFAVIASIIFYLRSITFARYKNIELNKEMFDHFKKNKYVNVIYSMSKRNADNLNVLNSVTENKLRHAFIAFALMIFSLSLFILLLLDYIIIKIR
jgi:hypothetical protein